MHDHIIKNGTISNLEFAQKDQKDFTGRNYIW